MRLEKAELVQKVRNMKMTGLSDKRISEACSIAPSTVWKYNNKNVMGSPVFYPIRRVTRARALKVVTLLRTKYLMTFASTFRFLNSLGFRITKDTLRGLYYDKSKAR